MRTESMQVKKGDEYFLYTYLTSSLDRCAIAEGRQGNCLLEFARTESMTGIDGAPFVD